MTSLDEQIASMTLYPTAGRQTVALPVGVRPAVDALPHIPCPGCHATGGVERQAGDIDVVYICGSCNWFRVINWGAEMLASHRRRVGA